jgi:hypothetical protein
MHLSRLSALAAALSVPAFAAPAPSPAGTLHPITCGDPKTIGTVIPARPTPATPHTEAWQVAAANGVCVIIGWTSDELVASWDDGAAFTPFAAGDKIQSAAVGDAGTIYVLRVGGMLDVFHTDGTVAHRDLTNGALGRLHVRGRWLWLSHDVVPDTPAISDDEGTTWRNFDWTEGDLVDLAVLDDGTVVGLADYHSVMCDHFGCGDGPFTAAFETTIEGQPWHRATKRHAQALPGNAIRDHHGFELDLFLVRVIGSTRRALYSTGPS